MFIMRLISWNVNGLRAAIRNGFPENVKEMRPDVLCLQETKVNEPHLELPGYGHHYSFAQKKGYSGTAVFTKHQPLRVTEGIGIEEHDQEGRVLTLEFEDFILVNAYVPNAQRGLTRLKYRQRWDHDFQQYLLSHKKPVLVCGDLNVAHTEIDLKNPKSNKNNAGFTKEEREGFTKLLESGFVDTFRMFTKEGGHYTWWSYMFNARARNIGWRIDYFLAQKDFKERVKHAEILSHIKGSDHCPVALELT